MIRNSFHLGFFRDSWGMLQGYVGVFLDFSHPSEKYVIVKSQKMGSSSPDFRDATYKISETTT